MIGGRTVIDFAGIHMGVATEDDQFYDYAGVHAGTVTPGGDVLSFERVRIGRVSGAGSRSGPEAEPAGAGAP